MSIKLKNTNLILFTGFIWLFAGFMLLHRAYSWIDLLNNTQLFFSVLFALILSVVKTYFIFHKLTKKNIYRIMNIKEPFIGIHKFHLLKDQILIVLMITFGFILRSTPFIPKEILMPIYLGIGFAMLYSSFLYMKYFIRKKAKVFYSAN